MPNKQSGDLEPIAAPRFRLLVVGKSGVGKTSLINQAFGVDLPVSHGLPSEHCIETPIPTPNDMFILHDSEGFERLQNEKYDVVHEFIKRHLEGEPENRLHAVWLCSSLCHPSTFEDADEKILTNYSDKIPVVMVFTQLDKFLGTIRVKLTRERPNVSTGDIDLLVNAELKRKLDHDYIEPLRQSTKNNKYPHAVVSTHAPHGRSVQGLVQTTQQLLVEKLGLTNNSATLGGSIAQRVYPDDKIKSSIEVALKGALQSLDNEASLEERLSRLDTDLIRIWNFEDNQSLLSQPHRLQKLRSGLRSVKLGKTDDFTPREKRTLALDLMNYTMDLTLVLCTIFHNTRTPEGTRPLNADLIDDGFDVHIEQKTAHVRAAIDTFDCKADLSQDGTQYVQRLIGGGRFTSYIDLPQRPTQIPSASIPCSTFSVPTALEGFLQAGADDADIRIESLQLQVARKRCLRKPKRSACGIEVLKTHQRFYPVETKQVAFLAVCLKLEQAKCPQLFLKGTLRTSGTNGRTNITNVWPPPHTEVYESSMVEHTESNTMTLSGGYPLAIQLGLSATRQQAWSEARKIVKVKVDSERTQLEMHFSRRPGDKYVPDVLPFAVLITYPLGRTAFSLDIEIRSGATPSRCTITCDGVTEIKKAAGPIPSAGT